MGFVFDYGGGIATQVSGKWKGLLDSPKSIAGLTAYKNFFDATSHASKTTDETHPNPYDVYAQGQAASMVGPGWFSCCVGDKYKATTKQFVAKLGKTIAVAEDFPAFIVNRILLPMINEAIYTLYEGVGNVEAIDTAMRLGAHHPMGPLELADFIGLDTCLSVMQVLHEGLADSKYRPCPLLVKYVEAGWLGRKTQRGFYDYRGEKPVPTR